MQIAKKRNFIVSESYKPYIELEYIESSGTLYIDTGIIPNFNDIKIISDILNKSNGSYIVLFGCGDYYPRFYLRFYSNTSYLEFNQNSTREVALGYRIQNTIKTDRMSHIESERGYITIDDNTYSLTAYGNLSDIPNTSLYSIFLFASNNNGSPFRNSSLKIKSFKIMKNTETLIDLISVKDLQNIICMYDKVSKTFFYNQGTGNFIAGPEI